MRRILKKIYNAILSPFDRRSRRDRGDTQQIPNESFFPEVVRILDEGMQATIPVKGFSMLPFIRGQRDLVVLEKKEQYVPYDIVLFRHHGRYVLHRILTVDGEKVEIQGDGVARNTERVLLKDICGKAVRILRDGKKEVDPDAPRQLRRARRWRRLRPVRRILLLFYRFAPWNYIWLRHQ